MWLELPNLWIALINIIGIPTIHLVTAWFSTLLPRKLFNSSTDLPVNRPIKPNQIYQKLFLIRQWKKFLPDAAPWFKGFSKKSIRSVDPQYLNTFIIETRRGEFSHWLQLMLITTFIIWTPPPAHYIIVSYAILSNLPCILNLRYTRQRMLHYLRKKSNHRPLKS